MQWIADRFFKTPEGWLDAATGTAVRVFISAPVKAADLAWDDQCARLANLRHPLLNPLVDYGIAATHRFEAYAAGGVLALPATVATRALEHAVAFVAAAGVELQEERCGLVLRATRHGHTRQHGRQHSRNTDSGNTGHRGEHSGDTGSGRRRQSSRDAADGRRDSGSEMRAQTMTLARTMGADGEELSVRTLRPVGCTLQMRRALSVVEDALDAMAPAGPAVVHVCGARGSGLRTMRVLAARSARLRGFTPVSPVAVARNPMMFRELADRHVCLMDDLDDPTRSPGGVAQLIAFLAAASARRHVVIRFSRHERGPSARVILEPMSIRALIGMVFDGGACGPSEDDLFTAARHSDGLPGVFLARLNGASAGVSSSFVVHETRALYVVEELPPLPLPAVGGRVLGGALRAGPRAAALARHGRHAAAERVLSRGLRVLQGRERHEEGSACALQLGWLALERGDPATAVARFEMARELAGESPRSVLASVGAGTALVDADRLVEGEAVLRGALAAAETLQDTDGQTLATAALGRCLYWQKRPHDAIALVALHPDGLGGCVPRARLLATYARCLARAGRTADAVRTARESQTLASAADDPGATASSELALAETLIAAGDADGAGVPISRAIEIARRSHLPLVRVRGLLLQAAAGRDATRDLRPVGRVHLPPLLAARVSSALSSAPVLVQRPLEPVAQLEVLLGLSQRAEDDATGLSRICAAVVERLAAAAVAVVAPDDRLLCLEGRSWSSVSTITKEAFAGGAAIPADGRREPIEAAEPVRFGGVVVAVLGCRWTAGTAVDRIESRVMMRAAALAAAPHVRAILDRRLPEPPAAWADLLGESAPAVALRESVLRAARAPFPVLIEGESGSGKELVARAVHRLGPRRDRRFCALNCAALTDDLVEAELFGHARGAFTGAATERAGLFEEADGGTLFLDEIGELSPRAQAKLLRVLQEGEVRRVGENMPRHVDVRIVAATNRRLADEVSAGRFRADLRFRLDVVRMTVPPLRERASDVPLLAGHFWRDASARVGSQATLSPEALAALARYDWPGNVRELQNVIAWIAVQSPRRGRVGPSALPRHVAQSAVSTRCTFEAAREDFERRFIRAALAGANGQRARAAEAIGVTRQGLAKMIRRLRLGDDEKTA